MKEIASRVQYADELHSNKTLSTWIQRELKTSRSKDIADYLLREDERFFSSLVIAVYGGTPRWVPLTIDIAGKNANRNASIVLPDVANDTLGVLDLSGEESLFTVDGQHRLSGMKELVSFIAENDSKAKTKRAASVLQDSVSVLFVAHTNDYIERTRRLFTTLNKTAKPVSKKETIALDENDAMAIVTRRLVERHPWFMDDRIALVMSNNLPTKYDKSFTSIGNLYDILMLFFVNIEKAGTAKQLQFSRLSDSRLDTLYSSAVTFFEDLADAIPELNEYFLSTTPQKVIKKHRHENGGHVIFRPLGLWIITSVAVEITRQCAATKSKGIVQKAQWQARVAALPGQLTGQPYNGVLWTKRNTIDPKAKIVIRDYLAYLVGLPMKQDLLSRYNAFKEQTEQLPKLPKRLFAAL